MNSPIDILAFGAHADDVEIGMGASIAKWSSKGLKIAICDLTKAELSSNGTVDSRIIEGRNAAEILGVSERFSLDIADRGIYINDANIQKVVEVIRKYKPSVIFSPYHEDRHPDHGNCARLVDEAFFSAGIRKFKTNQDLDPHRPKNHYHYMINGFHQPDFVIDVSDYIDKKLESLHAYRSQFTLSESGVSTPLTDGYIETVQARERLFGKEVGVKYAEGFKSKKPILLNMDVISECQKS